MDIPYLDRNISKDPKAKAEYVEKAYDLLPVVEVGNSIIVEYDGEPQLIEVLVQEGYL